MKLLGRLFGLFVIVSVVELALLIQVGQWIGLVPTVALILLTGAIGSYLAKREGLSVWRELQAKLDAGGLPGKELLDGVIILIAGALLITPGVLSDLSGIIGLFPPTRALIRKFVMRRLKKAVREGRIQTTFGGFGSASALWQTPPEEPDGVDADDEETTWSGTGHAVPHHQHRPGDEEQHPAHK